ncbi:MAG: ABC transporter substrate-binding protein [Thermomicrobiales bacterium]
MRVSSPLEKAGHLLETSLNRRKLLMTTAAGALLPVLANPALTFAQDNPKSGGTAGLVVGANPASWDLTKSTWVTWQAVCFLYDRLVSFDDNENLIPGLALSWDISEDGLEYTLKLRDGVLFHDGTPFDAEAVKFNIQRHIEKPDSGFYTVYEPVDHVEVVDTLTAKIVLKEIRPNFIYEGLAQWGALQLSPTSFAAQDPDNYGSPPVGTGPFIFDSYEPGSLIKYKKNEAYWAGSPLLDGIEVKVIPEPAVQLTELEAGTTDAIIVSPKDVQTVQDDGLEVQQRISPGVCLVSLNTSKGVTQELAVRKAIAMAVDRDTMIEALLYGFGAKSRAGVTEESPFYNADIPEIEFDPAAAGAILDEAGWVLGDGDIRQRDGQPLSVNILSTDFTDWALYNQAIQEQLKAVGIDSTISSLEWNAYLDQWRENQGDWNVSYHSQGSIMAATSVIQASWYPDAYWSVNQIDDATEPDLIEVRTQLQALQDEFEVTLDDARRKAIAKEAQTLYQDNQLSVWLWHAASITALQPRLHDYQLTHSGRVLELPTAWVD